jgi:thiol peroxidase
MAQTLLKGKPVQTAGNLPALKSKAPEFRLVDKDLKDRTLAEFKGKAKLIATVPSLDTGTCSTMTKKFNDHAKNHPEQLLITVSTDLPFAQKRFCEAEHVNNVLTLSMMRDKEFGKAYGILIQDGPLAGILARAVFVLDANDNVVYTELVPEITTEPNYQKALDVLAAL